MITYNKLVRDRIPAMIEAEGKSCQVEVLSEEAYLTALTVKLGEELEEFRQSGELGELADLLEVMHAIVRAKDSSPEALELLRQTKAQERGGFEQRLLLRSVSEAPPSR